jgi:hypothetical protein
LAITSLASKCTIASRGSRFLDNPKRRFNERETPYARNPSDVRPAKKLAAVRFLFDPPEKGERAMNRMSRAAAAGALLAALALGACVVSEQPVFPPEQAITPAAAGRYEQQEMKSGQWSALRRGTLQIDGRVYQWKPDRDEAIRFSVLDAGGGELLIHAAAPDEPGKPAHYYALARPAGGGFEFFQPLCRDLQQLSLPAEQAPKVTGDNCFYTERAPLIAALKAFAQKQAPAFRYVPVKE